MSIHSSVCLWPVADMFWRDTSVSPFNVLYITCWSHVFWGKTTLEEFISIFHNAEFGEDFLVKFIAQKFLNILTVCHSVDVSSFTCLHECTPFWLNLLTCSSPFPWVVWLVGNPEASHFCLRWIFFSGERESYVSLQNDKSFRFLAIL